MLYWAIGYDEYWNRDIGYGVPGKCDHPECNEIIDRGIEHVCGGEPYGGDSCCGLYFCKKHLKNTALSSGEEPYPACARCTAGEAPFEPTPDTDEWIHYKETSSYWAGWRTYHQNKSKAS